MGKSMNISRKPEKEGCKQGDPRIHPAPLGRSAMRGSRGFGVAEEAARMFTSLFRRERAKGF